MLMRAMCDCRESKGPELDVRIDFVLLRCTTRVFVCITRIAASVAVSAFLLAREPRTKDVILSFYLPRRYYCCMWDCSFPNTKEQCQTPLCSNESPRLMYGDLNTAYSDERASG